MIKSKTLLFLIFLASFCISGKIFSQNRITSSDSVVFTLEKHKLYSKNFNPGKYDPAIIKNCLIDMVSLLRTERFSVSKLLNVPLLDSVAEMQAEFQSLNDKLTDANIPPFQYTNQRLKKFGFSAQGTEIVTKAKAQIGDNDYSYFNLCLELIKPLLKAKGTPTLLQPKFTTIGVASGIDKNMKFVYISLILGNDLTTLSFNSANSKQKDLPISKGYQGLLFYDETLCKKCADDYSLEQIYDFLFYDEDGNVYLQSDDAKLVKKLLTKAGDAIVLDFVQQSQYNCRVPQVDNNKPFRGIVSKPIDVEKIFALNDSTIKSNFFNAKIGSIPQPIDLKALIDINILLLKERKYVCRTLIKKSIEPLKNYSAEMDTLFLKMDYETALYKLSPQLSDSTISENILFAVMRLAGHKPDTYLTSLFSQSVKMAAIRNPEKFCKIVKEMSISVFDNVEVRKTFCGTCQ